MSIKRSFILVAALLMIGTVAHASNMGFKITITIDDAGTFKNNWVSIPYHTSYAVADDVLTDLSDAGLGIFRLYHWIPSGGSEGFEYRQGGIFPSGVNFAITPGEALMVLPNTGGGGDWVVVGSHDPGLAVTIDAAGTFKNNWISAPYHTMSADADAILTELSSAGCSIFRLYHWITSGGSEGFEYRQGGIFPSGVNFAITPGEGLMVLPNASGGGSWTPSHY